MPAEYFELGYPSMGGWLEAEVLPKFGVSKETVTELPFDLDTSQSVRLDGLLSGFSQLTKVQDLDTRRCESMYQICLLYTSDAADE